MVLNTIGMFLAAGAINKYADKGKKKINPELNNDEFDAKCARLGINRVQVIDIAARCGVTPSKYGVLPEDGWKKCIKYISNYINDQKDVEAFKRRWQKVVEKQLDDKSQKVINKFWDSYQESYKMFLNNKRSWLSGPIITLELKHWHGLPKDQYIQRLSNIQSKTFWGELAIAKPILRHNPRFNNSFIEVWTLRGGEYDKQNSYLTNNRFKLLYKKCCGVCGYDAML